MKTPTTVPRIVTVAVQSLCLACVCSFAHAEGISFSGQLDVVLEDNGGARYSGFPLGTDFVGSIDDETFDGFIVDAVGTTNTDFSCCIAAGGLDVTNDSVLDADTAALINSLAGTSFIAGDLIDTVDIEGDAMTPGGGRIEIGLSFVLNPSAFDNGDITNYPHRPEDVITAVFFITESDNTDQEIYSAIGVLDDAYPLTRFDDVLRDHWAYSFVETLADSGVTGGCGGGNYCPEGRVTRAQMAVFLERGMNGGDFNPPPATGNTFLDVAANDFGAAFIEQLFLDGITGGCGGNNYCPNDDVTRAQMAVFLLRARNGSGYSPPPASGTQFADVDSGYWAVAWIEQFAAEGITGGCGGGNYCPDDPVTRAQMAVFLVRAFGLDVQASSGAYGIVPSAQYLCSFLGTPVINFSISQFDFQVTGTTLTVTGAPIAMAGSVDGRDFNVTGTIPGDVEEIYSLSGSFTSTDEWSGSFTLDLVGAAVSLTDCTNQQFDVQGARIP